MSSKIEVAYWAEGATDREVARSLIYGAGGIPGPDYSSRTGSVSGKDRLDQKLLAYNAAGRHGPFLVLRDLDRDADCAPNLVSGKLPCPSRFICFRVVVRAIESWLMADREAFAKWLQVQEAQVPSEPEKLLDPKAELIELAKKSRSRNLREGLLPSSTSGRRNGPLYGPYLQEFIVKLWRPDRIQKGVAPSLDSARIRLAEVVSLYSDSLPEEASV